MRQTTLFGLFILGLGFAFIMYANGYLTISLPPDIWSAFFPQNPVLAIDAPFRVTAYATCIMGVMMIIWGYFPYTECAGEAS